jgi:serine/threonine-protein kinase
MTLNGELRLQGLLSLYGYHFVKAIGSGDYGTCYDVLKNKTVYVLKVFHSNDVKRRKAKVSVEIQLIKKLKHPSIPQFIDQIDQDGLYGYIMTKIEGHTLENLMDWDYNFTKSDIFTIINQLIETLEYLDQESIIHRDIKISNMMWNHGSLFLIDFGSARKIGRKSGYFNLDFWGIGDVFCRLASASSEFFTGKHIWSIDALLMNKKQKYFIKRLLYIEKPYHTIQQIADDFHVLFEEFA